MQFALPAELFVPSPHLVHDDWPFFVANFPGLQSLHVVWPGSSWYVPGLHGLQPVSAPLTVYDVPGEHLLIM